MTRTEVEIRPLIRSQAEGQFGLLLAIHRVTMPIWIGIFLLIFVAIEGMTIAPRDVPTIYIIVGGIAALHALLLGVTRFRVGGPPAQPGYLVCTDDGLYMRYAGGSGAWRREKTIPWDQITGAQAGSFRDKTTVRARTTGGTVGSGAPMNVSTNHVGLVLFLTRGELRRQVWLHTKQLRDTTRAELNRALKELTPLATEIEEHVHQAGGTVIGADERDSRFRKNNITPEEQVRGHSPRKKDATGPAVGWKDWGLVLAFLLVTSTLTEIARPRSVVAELFSPDATSQSAADDGLLQIDAPDPIIYDSSGKTVVGVRITNHNEVPVRIEQVIIHGSGEQRDITELVTTMDGASVTDGPIMRPDRTEYLEAEIELIRPRWRRPIEVRGRPVE